MRKQTKLLVLAVLLGVSFGFGINKALADVSDSETYTVTIPSATVVQLAAASTDFGTITSAEYGTSNTSNHNILVGDGTLSSTSYIQSNDPTAGAKQYQLTFAPNSGSTVNVASGANKAVLTLGNSAGTASVNINLTDSAKSAYPKLGTGSPVAFSVLDSTHLNIAVSSSVPFDAASKKAPLDMLMDLDEASLGMNDASGAISFNMTMTVVGLN
jgi:hypothetical protein